MDDTQFERFDSQAAGTRFHALDAAPPPMAAGTCLLPRARVLVLGIVPSLTWSVARCLARAKMAPLVMGWHRVSPMGWLSGCSYLPMRDVRWIDDELDPRLIEQVETVCRVHRIETVVPVDFPSVMLLSRHGDGLRTARACAVPDADSMKLLHDKWRFSKLLRGLDLPQPATEKVYDVSELLSTKLNFPIITKPVDRWAGVGFQIHGDVRQLAARIAGAELTAEFPLLVQEYAPGRDVGFAFLARHGQLVAHAAFEQPLRGMRRYYDAPVLRGYVERLLERTGYHGVGEIDARYDPRRRDYRLLEVNPRFWASLMYARQAGMNFPELLVRLDELGDGPGFFAHSRSVRLSAYELAVAKTVQLAERTHRWRHA